MIKNGPHVSIDVYDYDREEKLCNLYDSTLESPGQANSIIYTNELSGWQELQFTMPYMVDGAYNHRWDFVRSEYMVRLTIGDFKDWFVMSRPKKQKDSKGIKNTVTCGHLCTLLKTKYLYAQFDDTNGIGTLPYLAEHVLYGTGWTIGASDVMLEKDGVTEKVRSLKSSEKKGAYQLITEVCNLFNAYPVFNGNDHTVSFYSINHKGDLREVMIGKDVKSLSVEINTEDIITRLYVEGEYAEDGYVGIDEVNPTGLSYLMNFDYFKELGLWKDKHQRALDEYITQIQVAVKRIKSQATDNSQLSNKLNTLWGQFKFAEYVLENGKIKKTLTGGENLYGREAIQEGDSIIIVKGVNNAAETANIVSPSDAIAKLKGAEITRRYYGKYMNDYSKGNVDLTKRPTVSSEAMKACSWPVADGQKFQLYMQGYTPLLRNGVAVYLCLTPIQTGGSVLSAAAMEEYVDKLVKNCDTLAQVMSEDRSNKNLIVFANADAAAASDPTKGNDIDSMVSIYYERELNNVPKYPGAPAVWNENTYRVVIAGADGAVAWANDDKYALKYITMSSGNIGAKESAIEGQKAVIKNLEREIDKQVPGTEEGDAAIEKLRAQIAEAEQSIETLYAGDWDNEGLREMTYEALELYEQYSGEQDKLAELQQAQLDIENTFAQKMGDFLRDGYWSDTNYILGQEKYLYEDALDVMDEMSKPKLKYSVSRYSLSNQLGYDIDNFHVNTQIRLYDPDLQVNDLVYVKKITMHLDDPRKDTIELSNESILLQGKSLESILSRISLAAEGMQQKKSLYDRAAAIGADGSIYVERLEGTINLERTRLMSAISSWYTDDKGNIMFETVDGTAAMMLCGEGFMIASGRNDDGSWNWRTFGTGRGFTADAIVSGFMSAARIEAGTITVDHVNSSFGKDLDISSNESITLSASKAWVTEMQQQTLSSIDGMLGYRVEIDTTRDILNQYERQTTLNAVVFHGRDNVTNNIPAQYFFWKRSSGNATADTAWNEQASHQGVKSITLNGADVNGSAKFICELRDGFSCDVQVKTVWNNADGSHTWPDGKSFVVQLQADGATVEGKVATLNQVQQTYTFSGLMKYGVNASTEIVYGLNVGILLGYTLAASQISDGVITVTVTENAA